MSTQENMKAVRKLYEIYNTNDPKKLNSCDEILSNSVKIHDPAAPQAKSGTQAVKQAESSYINAFPNKSTTIDSMIAAEDEIVVRWHTTGTQKGSFQGMQPTNRNFNISGISIYQFDDGKISEIWQNWDQFGLMQQLGQKQSPTTTSR